MIATDHSNAPRSILLGAFTVGLALLSHSAAAFNVTETYRFDSPEYYNSSAKTVTATEDSGVKAGVSGWYGAQASTTNLQNVTDKVVPWGNTLGINNQANTLSSRPDGTGPDQHHTIDNDDGYEYLALELEEKASLSEVSFGWTEQDSDFSIFYLNEGETFTGNLNAFSLAAHFFGQDGRGRSGDSYDLSSVTGNIVSAVWLIAGYNSSIAGTRIGHPDELSSTDGFKLRSVVTKRHAGSSTEAVPVPATLALFGAGLIAMRRQRRFERVA